MWGVWVLLKYDTRSCAKKHRAPEGTRCEGLSGVNLATLLGHGREELGGAGVVGLTLESLLKGLGCRRETAGLL